MKRILHGLYGLVTLCAELLLRQDMKPSATLKLTTVMYTVIMSGCDTFYGVRRTALLVNPISTDCITLALKKIPEINTIEYRRIKPNEKFSIRGSYLSDSHDQFTFKGAQIWGVVDIQLTHDKKTFLVMSSLTINHKPSQELINKARIVMEKIETLLERNCPNFAFQTSIVESYY